jgi:hypothetical protein
MPNRLAGGLELRFGGSKLRLEVPRCPPICGGIGTLGATMAVVTVPDFLPRQYKRARIVVLLLAFLGLISLAAVQAMTVECQDKYLTADDGITPLTADDGVTLLTTGRQRCQLVVGGGPVPLPVWAQPIMEKFAIWRAS